MSKSSDYFLSLQEESGSHPQLCGCGICQAVRNWNKITPTPEPQGETDYRVKYWQFGEAKRQFAYCQTDGQARIRARELRSLGYCVSVQYLRGDGTWIG